MNFDKPPVGPSSYEPLQTTNIVNTPTERLTELLAQWKNLLATKGSDSGVEAKISKIEKELESRQGK
jgi:hypothetical protein